MEISSGLSQFSKDQIFRCRDAMRCIVDCSYNCKLLVSLSFSSRTKIIQRIDSVLWSAFVQFQFSFLFLSANTTTKNRCQAISVIFMYFVDPGLPSEVSHSYQIHLPSVWSVLSCWFFFSYVLVMYCRCRCMPCQFNLACLDCPVQCACSFWVQVIINAKIKKSSCVSCFRCWEV